MSHFNKVFVLTITFFLIVKYSTCDDLCEILNKTIVKWKFSKFSLEQHASKGLHGLDEAGAIKITNKNIPVLCYNAVKDLKSLHKLDLSGNGIIEIWPGAFSNLPNLLELVLTENNIEKIDHGVFTGFLELWKLTLGDNNIEMIDENAFDLRYLRILDLSKNKIKTINSGWFKNTPNIKFLYLDDNKISILESDSFKGLRGKSVGLFDLTIGLRRNIIKEIHPEAFNGLEALGYLDLSFNQIENLHVNLFSDLKTIQYVNLEHNRINCLPFVINNILKALSTNLLGNPLNSKCAEYIKQHFKNGTYRVLRL